MCIRIYRVKLFAFTQAADLGSNRAHCNLGNIYDEGAMFHYKAAAIALESWSSIQVCGKSCQTFDDSGISWVFLCLRTYFESGYVSRESMDSTLAAYNDSWC